MSWPESKRWEAILAVCNRIEKNGVLGRNTDVFHMVEDTFEEMLTSIKERVAQVLKGVEKQLGKNGKTAIEWGKQQVDRWSGLHKTQKIWQVISD